MLSNIYTQDIYYVVHYIYPRYILCCPIYIPNIYIRQSDIYTHCILAQSDVHEDSSDGESSDEQHERRGAAADVEYVRLTNPIKGGVGHGMSPLRRARRGMQPPNACTHHDVWDRILCAGVPVSLRELVSFVATQLGLAVNDLNRNSLLLCRWTLGWSVKHKTLDGATKIYRGGGVTPETTSAYLRGDWVEVSGIEEIRRMSTSRLARVICGVQVEVIKEHFGGTLDQVVYLLVRYASPHPSCGRQRGPDYRPLCPGGLNHTHCLWKWHDRPRTYQRGCWRPRPWARHRHMFGNTAEEQNSRKREEARAWYDVIKVSDVTSHTNVTKDWDNTDTFLQSVMWSS